MRLRTRYFLLGILTGLLAPAGLLALGAATKRPLDPMIIFVVMAVGGVGTFSAAGWMIGQRDEALLAMATIDALTQLPNRRAFDTRLALEIARTSRYAAPLAVVMIDLDHFKQLNDRFGHQAGDQVLRHVAASLDREKRTGDLVARYGGEELVAVLPHTDLPSAAIWAERARSRLAAAVIVWDGQEVRVTASFGVAAADAHPALGRLVESADEALYEAKRGGRNAVVSRASQDWGGADGLPKVAACD